MRPSKHRVRGDRERDELLLMLMHLRENKGLTFGQIEKILPISRNAASAAHRRISISYEFRCECVQRENKDGGMQPLWWKEPPDGAQ